MIDDERIKIIADHYGIENQMRQLAEECSELAVEASHSARIGTTVKIIEEMADVLIMMEQVVYLSGIDRKDIDECIQYKLDRQMKRIENESFGNGIQNLHAATIRQRLKQSEADIKAMSESETGRDWEDNHD